MSWEDYDKLFNVVAVIYVVLYLILYGRWELNWWRELLSKKEPSRKTVNDLNPKDRNSMHR